MNDGARRLEAYLAELHRCLAPLSEAERAEIVAEIRGHVLESAGAGPSEGAASAVLERLGPAGDLAAEYVASSLLAGAARSRSPWTVLTSLARLAGAGFAGVPALLGCALGYGLALSLALAALRKPMAPERVGLWQLGADTYSLRLGFGEPPAGRELLGWWIVPIGLLAGAACLWLTTRLGRWALLRFRRSPLRPSP
jgi:hypothetical protein